MSTQQRSMYVTEQNEDSDPSVRVTADHDRLKAVIDALSAAYYEAIFRFEPDGLTAVTTDPASVLLAEVTVDASEFDTYEASGVRFGFDLHKLENFGLIGDETDLGWDSTDRRVHLRSGPSEVEAGAISPDEIAIKRPKDAVYEASDAAWRMPYEDLATAINVVDNIKGPATDIHAGPDGVRFEKGTHTDASTVELPDAEYFDSRQPDEVQTTSMGVSYLKEVRQAIPSETTVSAWTGTDYPIIFEYTADGADVTFMQAPRLDRM